MHSLHFVFIASAFFLSSLTYSWGRGGEHPPLQRGMSDFGPTSSWDSYGRRGGGGRQRGDWGRRRSEDLGPRGDPPTLEDWNKPLPKNERIER